MLALIEAGFGVCRQTMPKASPPRKHWQSDSLTPIVSTNLYVYQSQLFMSAIDAQAFKTEFEKAQQTNADIESRSTEAPEKSAEEAPTSDSNALATSGDVHGVTEDGAHTEGAAKETDPVATDATQSSGESTVQAPDATKPETQEPVTTHEEEPKEDAPAPSEESVEPAVVE